MEEVFEPLIWEALVPVGFRIGPFTEDLDTALVARFAAIPVAVISDAMWRLSAGGARLRPLGKAAFCGPALTVRTAPGDNLMVHKALDLARAGDVLVIDAGGDLTNAIMGERMLAIAEAKGVVAIVINGAIRDLPALRASSVSVFAAGVTHRGPYKNGPGEVNFPIALDGMVVHAGDLVAGDDDGLVCVPHADLIEVCIEAERRAEMERVNDPLTEPRDWVDASLVRLGCLSPA